MFTMKRGVDNKNGLSLKSQQLTAAFLSILLGSCAVGNGSGDQEPVLIQENQSHISTNMAEFTNDPRYYVRHNKISADKSEIAQFSGRDSGAVVMLLYPGPGRVIGARALGSISVRYIEAVFQEDAITWEDKGNLRISNIESQYRFFSVDGKEGRCASFERQWGRENGDDRNRNRSAAVGFYCREGGLEDSHVERFLDSLSFR